LSRKITKKIVRIALIVIGAFIALDLLVVALIFVPPIQQKIVDVVTEKLSDKLQSRISVDKIYLSPTLKLNAEGFTIYDHRDEPMISAGKLQSRLLGLELNPTIVSLDDTKGENVQVVLHKYFGDASINISMWAQKLKKDKKEKKPFTLKIKSIDLTDTYFVLIDDKKRVPNNTTNIDYAFFEFKDISWHLDDFLLNGSDISAHFDRMSYNQYTGFQLLNLTGDFKIGAHGMELNDAVIVTPSSHLFLDLAFEYEEWADYGAFLDSVRFRADLRTSTFDMGTLQYFATATRGMDDTLVVSCKVNGPVNDLHVTDLKANFKDNTLLAGDISMKKIPDFFNAEIHMHLPQNQIDLKEVADFRLPKGKAIPVPTVLQKMEKAVVDIDFDGFVRDGFDARITLNSGNENLNARLVTQNNESTGRIAYNAKVSTSGIDLGSLLNRRDLFGRVVMSASADGSVDMSNFMKSLDANVKADVQRIDFKHYPLRNLHVQGRYSDRFLNGQVAVKDPACQLQAQVRMNRKRAMPEYSLSARIDSLSATRIFGNLAPVDSATAKGLDKFVYYVQQHPEMAIRADSIGCNLYGNSLKELSGNVFIDNLAYSQDDYLLESERLRLVLLNDGYSQIYRFTSDLMNAGIATNYDVKEIPDALIDLAYNYCGNLLPDRKEKESPKRETESDMMRFLDLDLSVNEIQPVLQIFVPAIKIANGTTARISTTSIHDNDKIDIHIPHLSVKDKVLIDQIMVNGDQQDSGIMQVMASVSSVALGKEGSFTVTDIALNSLVGDNELGAQLSWQNPKEISNSRSQIGGVVEFPAPKNITVQVKTSDIYFKDYLFHFNDQNLIKINGNMVDFDNLVLGDGERQVSINGRIQEGNDSLVCLAENVDLDVVNQLLKSQKMSLLGDLSANVQMRTFRGNRVIFGSTIIQDFEFNNEKFGNLFASAAVPTGDNVLFQGGFIMPEYFPEDATIQKYTFRDFQKQDHVHIHLNGNYGLKEKALRVTADIDTLKLGFLAPFLSSFSHVMEGDASGKIDFVMNADSLYFDGKAFVRQANLGIRPLNTVYTIEGQTIDFNKDGFEFNDVVLKDKYGNTGTLKGYIHHEKFNNFDLNLAIKTGRLMVLNTVQKTDNPFYGDAFVSGDVAIFGNMDKLYFAGNNLRTERGTRFCLPISFADKVSDSDVITFKTQASDDRDSGPVENTAEKSNMEMDFNFILDVTPTADILLDLDLSAFGGSIKTSGEGRLHFTYNTKSDINLTGDVQLHSGSFMMNFMGLVSKKFELVEGGTVTFPGPIDDIRINVSAMYSTTASLADIFSAESTTLRRMPVKAYLNFNGTLNDPAAIDFSFDLPNATSDMKTLFYSAIDTNNIQNRTEQFFSLVMLGKFVSNSSVNNNTGIDIGNTGINLLTNTLSNFISQQLKYVDVNFKYQNANEAQAAQYSVSASTSLFNDRTVIEGYFGYVDDKEMNASTQFIGDFSIEQKLNDQGNWRVKVFNVTNQDELRNATHNSPYAQGVAVIYKQDFNNRQDLADSFKRNKERKKLKKKERNGK
jgi:hypothetical protein